MAGCWHMSELRDAVCLGGQLTYTKCSGFLPVSATSCCSSLLCQIPEMVTVTLTEGERRRKDRKDEGGEKAKQTHKTTKSNTTTQ